MDSRNTNLYNKGSKNAFYFKLWIKLYRKWSIHSFRDCFCWFIADLNFLKMSHVIWRISQIFRLDLSISCCFLRMEIIFLYYSSLPLVSYMVHFYRGYIFLHVFLILNNVSLVPNQEKSDLLQHNRTIYLMLLLYRIPFYTILKLRSVNCTLTFSLLAFPIRNSWDVSSVSCYAS